ncbi:hypothetical protein MCBRY_003645 [Methylocystis bryophila]
MISISISPSPCSHKVVGLEAGFLCLSPSFNEEGDGNAEEANHDQARHG